MKYILKLKMFLCKLFTLSLPRKYRKNVRNFLFWFSISDYLRFKKQNFHIVSLGSNCLPKVFTTAIKLKPRKFYGEKTLPFDLYISRLEEVIDYIKNDFKGFFDNVDLVKNKYPHDYKMPFEQFKERYTRRIQNFREIMNSDKMIYFVYSNFSNPDIQELYNVIKEKRGEKPFKLIYLNSKNFGYKDIIEITEEFQFLHDTWAYSFINQYKDKNDRYTEYSDKVGKVLKEIIK